MSQNRCNRTTYRLGTGRPRTGPDQPRATLNPQVPGCDSGSQTGSQRPRSPANAHAHSTTQIGLVPVFVGRPRTCTDTPWVHDAQGVGGSSPSWRTHIIVGNWRFSTVRGPSVARFGASGVCSAFWHPLLEPVCDIRVQRLPTPSTRSPLSGPNDRWAWTQDLT